MKSSIVVSILAVIIVVVIALYAFHAQAPTVSITPTPDLTSPSPVVTSTVSPAATSPAAVTNPTIKMTDTGFEPATLTVPVNTTVTFVNDGQGPHWPASDPHPIHTDLSGFDAKHGLQTGETYQFTFTKIGTWGFHDHLHSNVTGQIIVK